MEKEKQEDEKEPQKTMRKRDRVKQSMVFSFNDLANILATATEGKVREEYLDACAQLISVGRMFGFTSARAFTEELLARYNVLREREQAAQHIGELSHGAIGEVLNLSDEQKASLAEQIMATLPPNDGQKDGRPGHYL